MLKQLGKPTQSMVNTVRAAVVPTMDDTTNRKKSITDAIPAFT